MREQRGCGLIVDELSRDESVQWCHGAVVSSDDATSDAELFDEFDPGLKIVEQKPQSVGIECIHGRDRLMRIKAPPAEDLAHVGPVLLLDVGVIVLVMGRLRVKSSRRSRHQ